MKARCFPVSDIKSKDSRWDTYFSSFNMEEYLATLDYDEVTTFLDRHTNDLPQDAPILDVGCGSGRHLVHLSNMGFKNLHGFDLSPHGIKNLEAYRPGMNLMVADATKMPYGDRSFDAVVMVGIVYEIPDPEAHAQLFREIARVLKPGGRLLFINNSPYHLGERIYTLTQWAGNLFKREELKFFVWRYQPADVRRHLAGADLEIKQVWPANIRRGVFRFMYGAFVPRRVLKARQQRLRRLNGQPYGLHEYYLVQKQPELLTGLGRLAAGLSQSLFPRLFANTICHRAEKPVRS
jgi:SAM-dependent methyltransferase